jgi:hypothetical protein
MGLILHWNIVVHNHILKIRSIHGYLALFLSVFVRHPHTVAPWRESNLVPRSIVYSLALHGTRLSEGADTLTRRPLVQFSVENQF